ncbi:MAG: rod shape-determining protein RodA [Clostridia bacterium]|nr:rod shape-determining protein RodA [Clostridia bacterium]
MKLRRSLYARNFDWLIVIIITGIVCISLLMLANASFNPFNETGATGAVSIIQRIDFKYVILQSLWYLLGLVAMCFIMFVDYHTLAKYGKLIYAVNVLVLLTLLILGKTTRGIKGWFTIGERGFQPSEVCKITIIIFIGRLISRKIEERGDTELNLYDLLPIIIYFAIPFILVVMQPDFGTAMVYVASFGGMLFMAKIDKKIILGGIVALIVLIPIAWLLLADWQKARITGLFQGGGEGMEQVESSKMLIGSGKIVGKGFFREGTLAQLNFLAEKHTDFIFAFVVETTGWIGGMVVILLYFAMLARILFLAQHAGDVYGKVIGVGVLFMFIAHIFENIAMTMGVMPVTGIPAPFLSYGGSSMLANMMAIGLLESVAMRRDAQYRN